MFKRGSIGLDILKHWVQTELPFQVHRLGPASDVRSPSDGPLQNALQFKHLTATGQPKIQCRRLPTRAWHITRLRCQSSSPTGGPWQQRAVPVPEGLPNHHLAIATHTRGLLHPLHLPRQHAEPASSVQQGGASMEATIHPGSTPRAGSAACR